MLRHQVDQRGGFLLLGNTQGYDCAAGVPAPVVGTVGNCGSNTADTAADIFVRSDDPNHSALADLNITNPMARTTAVLPLPAGASVTYARIYWSAENVNASVDTNILVERPDATSQVVTADASWTQTMNSLFFYGAAADITPFVQAQGAGPFRVSGIDSVNLANLMDNSSYVVWAMVVLYRDPNMPMQNLAVFDGFDLVQNGGIYTGTIDGFTVPTNGYTASLGIVAYEGDNALTGDTFSFNGTALSNALNPVNNFLNGTHSYNGVAVSQVGDLPQLSGAPGSVSGLDMDVVDITTQVAAGDTSASLVSSTSSDTYLFGVFTTAISTLYPDLSDITKSVTNLSESTATRVGDHLHVDLTFSNTGSDTAVDVVLSDTLATGLDFVPGSLVITSGAGAGSKSDGPGDDQAEYDATTRTVVFRLGVGADATSGGNITTSDPATRAGFDIAINPACGITVDNQGVVRCRGQLSLVSHPRPTQYPSGNGADANTPVTVVVDTCAGPGDCPVGASACSTTTHPFMCLACTSDAECPTVRPTCDTQTGSCVACIQDADCGANQYCLQQACVARTPSGIAPPTGTCAPIASACETGLCDPLTGLCGAPASHPCGQGNDCASLACASDQRCGLFNGQGCEQDTSCRAEACGSDGLCGKVNGQGCSTADVCRSSVCNADTALCSVCNDASDCPGGALCASGACIAPPNVERFAGGSLGCSAGGKPDAALLLMVVALLTWRCRRRLALARLVLLLSAWSGTALARNEGYAVERYAPSTVQDWTFRVERPWYRERWQDVGVGLTLDYSHNPLLLTAVTPQDDILASQGIISHALFGHLQVATSWFDRLTVLAEMPVLLAQSAHTFAGITPTSAVAFADPRLGARVRLWNHPEVNAISLNIAGDLWIPVRSKSTVGDRAPRGLVRAIAGGVLFDHVLWTASAGMLARPTAELSNVTALQPQTTGAELQFGAALGWTNTAHTWHVGPEFTYDTTVNQSHAFTSQASTIEALLGAQARVTRTVRIGAAVGTALLREPGTPDFRALARVSWQPSDVPAVRDSDADGVPDTEDRCPVEPQGATPDPNLPGCPLRDVDRDGDGVLDAQDLCPDTPAGAHADPKRPGCPLLDTDGDGIFDADDACPTVPGVANLDPNKNGCPKEPAPPPPKALERLVVPPIHFELNRARLLAESDVALHIALDALEHRADIRVSIEGHTDNTGAEGYNVDLSKRRAKAVVKWLVAHHVDPARLQSDGFGPHRPVADNATLQGRRTNRRVEFVVQSSTPPK